MTEELPSTALVHRSPVTLRRFDRAGALACGVAVLFNAAWHVTHGRWFDAFWLCNTAAAAAAFGLLARSSLLATVAFIWLIPGTLAWGSEAALLGSSFSLSSYALHLGGSACAVWGVLRFGAHPKGYRGALVLLASLLVLSRFLPVEGNVNCAFGPRAGWWVFQWLPLPHFVSVALMALVLSAIMNQIALSLSARRTQLRDRPPSPARSS